MAATRPPVRPLLRRRYDERQAEVVATAARLSGEEVADGWCDLILRSARP